MKFSDTLSFHTPTLSFGIWFHIINEMHQKIAKTGGKTDTVVFSIDELINYV